MLTRTTTINTTETNIEQPSLYSFLSSQKMVVFSDPIAECQ